MTDAIDFNELKKTLAEFASTREWKKFHSPKNLSMAISCEAGELLEIFQWMTEQESLDTTHDQEIKEKIRQELADIILYTIRLAGILDINLEKALHDKITINNKKYPTDKVKGSAKKYTNYTD